MTNIIRKLELVWRHRVVYPVLKLFLRNKTIQLPVDLSSVRSVLILRFDRLGDMVVTTPILRALRKTHPHLRIGVFASELNSTLIKNNPNVDEIYILHSSWMKLLFEIWKVRKKNYDVVLNFIFNRTTSSAILANIVAPRGIKIGQGDEKYRFYFNQLLKLPKNSGHMVETLAYFLDQSFELKILPDSLSFELMVDAEGKLCVGDFLSKRHLTRRGQQKNGKPYIVLNMSASRSERNISLEQMRAIISELLKCSTLTITIISAPSDVLLARSFSETMSSPRVCFFPDQATASILSIIEIISGAVGVITPDTGIVHFASAVKTPVLGFFAELRGSREWLPFQVPHKIIEAPPGALISAIPIENIRIAVKEFIDTIVTPSMR
jgi:ADP-heptose:LPS heptosyltransferase